jgi:hypothetical protein
MAPQHSLRTGQPIASTLLRTVATVAFSAGCLGLSVVEQFRILGAGRLLAERERLIGELLEVERRERRHLSEQLHDEALQYVFSARMDLEDVCDRASPDALRRLDVALAHVSAFLRGTVGQLGPVIVDQWGLPDALRQLADRLASDGGATVAVDSASWPPGAHTSADALLLATARELLSYIAGPCGRDDGRGLGDDRWRPGLLTGTQQRELLPAQRHGSFISDGPPPARGPSHPRRGRRRCAGVCPHPPPGTVATVLMPAMPLPRISAT